MLIVTHTIRLTVKQTVNRHLKPLALLILEIQASLLTVKPLWCCSITTCLQMFSFFCHTNKHCKCIECICKRGTMQLNTVWRLSSRLFVFLSWISRHRGWVPLCLTQYRSCTFDQHRRGKLALGSDIASTKQGRTWAREDTSYTVSLKDLATMKSRCMPHTSVLRLWSGLLH